MSIRDCKTTLDHTVWQWLFKASELIIDRNPAKLLCPVSYEKNVASGNSMCQLFNNRLVIHLFIFPFRQSFKNCATGTNRRIIRKQFSHKSKTF